MINIVLVMPEIPQNTGNISRTCAVTGAALHLVEPLGFSVENRYLKRAGLDYWDKLNLHIHPDFDSLADFAQRQNARILLASTHAKQKYTDVKYRRDDFLVFGRETAGLGSELLARYPDKQIRIPMRPLLRSLNLSNSVAIVVYEALRQFDFDGLE